MVTGREKQSRQARALLLYLEEYWQTHHPELKLQESLTDMLHIVREELARDSDDARLIITTYTRSLKQEIKPRELVQANAAIKRLLKSLGIITVGVLPLSFITLPGLFALARYFNIDLLPEKSARKTRRRRK